MRNIFSLQGNIREFENFENIREKSGNFILFEQDV
jgi:hypothetical protein